MRMICAGSCRQPRKPKHYGKRPDNRITKTGYGWKPVKRDQYDGEDYDSRNQLVRAMGYRDYADYLGGPMWRKVREMAYQKHGRKCSLCGADDAVIHHLRYHHDDLTGRTVKYLRPLCFDCHEAVEFDRGRKRSMSEAVSVFLRKWRLKYGNAPQM